MGTEWSRCDKRLRCQGEEGWAPRGVIEGKRNERFHVCEHLCEEICF